MGAAAVAYYLLPYWIAIAAISVLVVHEYSHFFAALWTKAKATAPIFIPLGIFYLGFTKIRTRTKEQRRKIAIAGPIGGITVALLLLLVGLAINEKVLVIAALVAMAFETFSGTLGSDGRRFRKAQ